MSISNLRKPEWLKIKLNTNDQYTGLKKMMREKSFILFVKKQDVPTFMNAGRSEKRQLS